MTRGVFILVHTDGGMVRVGAEFPLTLPFLQGLVQGPIEMVRMGEGLVACVNEEGRLESFPDNARYPNLAGPVLLFSDWVDPESEIGERDFGPLSDAQLRMLEGGGKPGGDTWATPYMDRTRTIPDSEFGVFVIDPAAGRPKGRG